MNSIPSLKPTSSRGLQHLRAERVRQRRIAEPGALPRPGVPLHVTACHETDDAHCVGWLHRRLNQGNNIALRLQMCSCTNVDKLRLRGAQHATFEATLPPTRRR